MFASITPESEEDEFTLWKPDARLPQTAPDAVVPAGLDAQRQWYLYNSIREFAKEEHRDILCPLPTVPKPTTQRQADSRENDLPPPAKRGRGSARGGRRSSSSATTTE